MDHRPPPRPPPSHPPPVAVAAIAGAMAAAATAGEAAATLPAPFPTPNGGGARPLSDSGGGEEWGSASAGGAAVNAAAATMRGGPAASWTMPYRSQRAVRPPAAPGVGRRGSCTWRGGGRAAQWPRRGQSHARAGGGRGWSPLRRGGRPCACGVGRGRSRTDARAGGMSGVCGRRGGDPDGAVGLRPCTLEHCHQLRLSLSAIPFKNQVRVLRQPHVRQRLAALLS